MSADASILAAKVPDAPLSLQNVAGLTSAYQIGIQWTEGAYNGASPVLNYEVSYKEENDSNWSIWIQNIEQQTDIIFGLIPSTNYKFRVRSRNIIGQSDYSSEVTITAA